MTLTGDGILSQVYLDQAHSMIAMPYYKSFSIKMC